MDSLKRGIFFILVILSVIVLALRLANQFGMAIFPVNQKSGISILSTPSEALVYLDNNLVGKTPYEDQNLSAKEYQLKLTEDSATGSATASWQGKVKLTGGTLTVVNRDLAKDPTSAAGEIITLEKGHGVTIISSPVGAGIEIDGKNYGVTPISADLSAGKHIFVLRHSNYSNRSIPAQTVDNYNLVINADLAISEADLTSISTPAITTTQRVVVKKTPNGFLRIRKEPDINSPEIGRVSVGEQMVLLEEQGSWDRVRLVSGIEGFASTEFLEKF
ncbi:MAG: PEGA domain-containing protein [Candidatus Daviesbacteria bacterium]|nr:PEGA domain-containing protein [Candidatus Daviesbacteria bacterium]